MLKKTTLIVSFFFLFLIILNAQVETDHPNKEKKEKGIYEIITSGVYVYSFNHKESLVGAEAHFTYWFTHTWGAGLSYSSKFGKEDILHDLSLIGSVNPTRWITVNIGPNFAFPSKHRAFEFGLYSEIEINIRLTEWFHFGPVLGAVISKNTEAILGLHLGFEF